MIHRYLPVVNTTLSNVTIEFQMQDSHDTVKVGDRLVVSAERPAAAEPLILQIEVSSIGKTNSLNLDPFRTVKGKVRAVLQKPTVQS